MGLLRNLVITNSSSSDGKEEFISLEKAIETGEINPDSETRERSGSDPGMVELFSMACRYFEDKRYKGLYPFQKKKKGKPRKGWNKNKKGVAQKGNKKVKGKGKKKYKKDLTRKTNFIGPVNKPPPFIYYSYSQRCRSRATKNKKYLKIFEEAKKTFYDNNPRCKELDHELTKLNSKTCHFDKIKEYFKVRNEYMEVMKEFFNDPRWRRHKLDRYINTQMHEAEVMNMIYQTIGPPSDVIICMGDWARDKPMKGREPFLGKGIKRMLRKNGYKVYTVSEHRTSHWCSCCESKDHKCVEVLRSELTTNQNPIVGSNRSIKKAQREAMNGGPKILKATLREQRKKLVEEELARAQSQSSSSSSSQISSVDPLIPGEAKPPDPPATVESKKRPDKIRGLLRCTNTECKKFLNRDRNGAINILKIAEALLKRLPRPEYLCYVKKDKPNKQYPLQPLPLLLIRWRQRRSLRGKRSK